MNDCVCEIGVSIFSPMQVKYWLTRPDGQVEVNSYTASMTQLTRLQIALDERCLGSIMSYLRAPTPNRKRTSFPHLLLAENMIL